MTAPIIRAQGVGKQYRLGGPQKPTNSLREALVETAKSFTRGNRAGSDVSFWALNDVSFDVQHGEVLGLIGRNGAGKSTLLKVLSRITEPTKGRIELRGRAASLLEVGTGFHPELTGRENVYLNGTILGMRKREIDRKFDEIVAFAEVDQFIDTPVKRYSSGMYVRLAFAVAAHLEPEILVVDEVLAVGDAEFQKKCLGKMSDVAHAGRTVLFVSHNMAAMRALCPRSLFLKQGRVEFDGPTESAISKYLDEATGDGDASSWCYRKRGRRFRVDRAELLVDGQSARVAQSGDEVTVRVHYTVTDPAGLGADAMFFVVFSGAGQRIANCWTNARMGHGVRLGPSGYVDCVVPKWPYRGMPMRVELYTEIGFEAEEWIDDLLTFDSSDGDYFRTGLIPHPGQGIEFIDHEWRSEVVEQPDALMAHVAADTETVHAEQRVA